MSTPCPHCGGPKAEFDKMCADCHALFHGSAKPAAPAVTAPEPQPALKQEVAPSGTPPVSTPDAAPRPAGNTRLLKLLVGMSLLVVIVVCIVKLVAFADTIKFRTPEQKRLWYEQKVQAHEQAIRKYAAAQEAKGIFRFTTFDITADEVSFQIEQLSDPSSTDITADVEKFRGKLLAMLGSYTPVYIDTYYRIDDARFLHVGTNTYTVGASNVPGVEGGSFYPGACRRVTAAEQ